MVPVPENDVYTVSATSSLESCVGTQECRVLLGPFRKSSSSYVQVGHSKALERGSISCSGNDVLEIQNDRQLVSALRILVRHASHLS